MLGTSASKNLLLQGLLNGQSVFPLASPNGSDRYRAIDNGGELAFYLLSTYKGIALETQFESNC